MPAPKDKKIENLPKAKVLEAFANKWDLPILVEEESLNIFPYIKKIGKDYFIVFYSALFNRGVPTKLTKPMMLHPQTKLQAFQLKQLIHKVTIKEGE